MSQDKKNFVAVRTQYYKRNAAQKVLAHGYRKHSNSPNVYEKDTRHNFGMRYKSLDDCMAQYKATSGRKPQDKMNVLFEHVVVFSEGQFKERKPNKKEFDECMQRYIKAIHAAFGFQPMGYELHLDEGHTDEKTGEFKRNIHAHVYFFNYDFKKKKAPLRDLMKKGKDENGKTLPLNHNFVKMQDMAAMAFKPLGFRRGISKGERNRKHLDKGTYVVSKKLSEIINRYDKVRRLVHNLDKDITAKKLKLKEQEERLTEYQELEELHNTKIQPMLLAFENLEDAFKAGQDYEEQLNRFNKLQSEITEKDLKKAGRKIKKI
ncbi:hypothetical protein [Alcanivorax sp.]|uniref:hypothetical protein n=1 Tax=Alcanivorax sp. TaxID=1872427 RepID=UPI0032D907FB